jgi:hypothetical protein
LLVELGDQRHLVASQQRDGGLVPLRRVLLRLGGGLLQAVHQGRQRLVQPTHHLLLVRTGRQGAVVSQRLRHLVELRLDVGQQGVALLLVFDEHGSSEVALGTDHRGVRLPERDGAREAVAGDRLLIFPNAGGGLQPERADEQHQHANQAEREHQLRPHAAIDKPPHPELLHGRGNGHLVRG